MFCKITYEFPEDTTTALFRNWLVNLSGKEDGFIELDLMQEHFNLMLESLAEYKGKDFSNPWYRLVLSMHVHHFIRLKEEMEKMVGLVPRRKGHTEPHLNNEFSELLRIFRERDIHTFQAGRDLGYHCPDHFAQGFVQLTMGRLQRFVERSMQGRGGLEKTREMTSSFPDPPSHLHHAVLYNADGQPTNIDRTP